MVELLLPPFQELKPLAYRNPIPTVDIIIELSDRPHRPIVLIERLNEPYGWAIPGGFVDYGEPVEVTARREAQEETGLAIELIEQFQVYSDPSRDPRKHTLSVVFIAVAKGEPQAGDDAKGIALFESWRVPENLCFDHDRILRDYWRYRHYGLRPRLV
ncbi:NUDIX domain-containing protein [Trichocoleus sp. FACHB-262]|uniref:NUDIX domain-containing protein n=1 Tax=Trichocoleus sp. FACHB-262 TaxID=2692869 RepID=UPI0037DDB909